MGLLPRATQRHSARIRRLGTRVLGSTDMGNVSQLVPSIHPMIAVAPEGVAIHTEEFARSAGGPSGDRAVIDGAKALAATVIDCWATPWAITANGDSSA
ncbi:MAG: hypothetical protein R2735_09435 [Microthrixaceae bacterium]